jgi:hypothetical protein
MDNACLKIAIIKHLKTGTTPMTEEEMEAYCKSKDICVGIVSPIKVSPYYFNTSGSKIIYQFLDIKTNKMSPLLNKKTGKAVNRNNEANKISWGEDR